MSDQDSRASLRAGVYAIAYLGLAAVFAVTALKDPKDGLLVVGYRDFGQLALTAFMTFVAPLLLLSIWTSIARLVMRSLSALRGRRVQLLLVAFIALVALTLMLGGGARKRPAAPTPFPAQAPAR